MQQTASWLQRVLALIIDWIVSMLVVMLVVGADGFWGDARAQVYTHVLFVVETAVFTALLGGSFGKLAIRLRVVRADGSGRPVDLFRALGRQVMVALVIPPLVFRPDGRGLHDMAMGTVSVQLKDIHPDLASRS